MATDCRKEKPGGREEGSTWVSWRCTKALPGVSLWCPCCIWGACTAALQCCRGEIPDAVQCCREQCNAMPCNAMQCNAMQCNAVAVHAAALGTCAEPQGRRKPFASVAPPAKLRGWETGNAAARSSGADVAAVPLAVLRLLFWQLLNTQNSHKRVSPKRCADAAPLCRCLGNVHRGEHSARGGEHCTWSNGWRAASIS